jgi:hypothetical protein
MTIYTSGDAITAEIGDRFAWKFVFTHDFEFQTNVTFDSQRLVIPCDCTLQEIHAKIKTAPTGQAAIFNVKKNGVELFSGGDRPTIAALATTLNKTEIDQSFAAGDYLDWVDVQKGSTVAGGYGAFVLVFK